MNYVHQKGVDSGDNLNVRTTSLPVQNITFKEFIDNIGSGTITSEYYTNSWGHTGQDLFDKVCVALGSQTKSDGTDAGIEIMFRAYSNQTNSRVNFKFNRGGLIKNFRGSPDITGVEPLASGTYWPLSEYTLYNGSDIDASIKHTSTYNPQYVNIFYFRRQDYAMTNFPFYPQGSGVYAYIACNAYYGESETTSSRWLVDNNYAIGSEPANNKTIHQIWVRANKPT